MQGLGWAVLVCLGTAGSAAAQFRGFGVHGDAIPGTSDTIDRVSAAVALGDNSVAFHVRGTNTGQYVIVDVGGVDTVIAVQGATAPGGQSYGTFAELRGWGSRTGAGLSGSHVTFSSNGVTYLWSSPSGPVRALALDGLVGINTAGQSLHLTSSQTLTFVDTNGTQTPVIAVSATVPGDPTFTVGTQGILMPYLHENGHVTFQLNGTNGSDARTYIFQGPPAAPVLRESHNTLPTQLGSLGLGLLAASPNGDLAWWITYGTDSPTTSHAEIKLRRGQPMQIAESLDGAPIMIDGAPYQFDLSNVGRHLNLLTDTQFVMYAAGASGLASSVVTYHTGAWHKVAADTETLPGGTSPGVIVSSVVGDRLLLDSAGPDGAIWSWTSGVVQTVALSGQTFGDLTATNVTSYEGNAADDGIIIAVAHDISGGGTKVSGFITGSSSAAGSDFEIVELTGVRGRVTEFIQGTAHDRDTFNLQVKIRNNGPTTDRYVLSAELDAGMSTKILRNGDDRVSCEDPTCTSGTEIPAGGEQTVSIAVYQSPDSIVTIYVAPLTQNDPNLANSVKTIMIGYEPNEGCCSMSRGSANTAFLGMALVWLGLRRRRHAR